MVVAIVATLVTKGLYVATKGTLERAAVEITAAFAAACVLRFLIAREPYFLWSALLMATLMGREIRFPGASNLVYVALALLALYALRRLNTFWSRLGSPALLTGLAFGFFTYALAVAIDQRWARGLPGEKLWQMPVEETVEIVGHVAIGLSLLLSRRCSDSLPDPLKRPIPLLRH